MATNKNQSAFANLNIHPISYCPQIRFAFLTFGPCIKMPHYLCISRESHMFQTIQLDHFASKSNKFAKIFTSLLSPDHWIYSAQVSAPVRLVCIWRMLSDGYWFMRVPIIFFLFSLRQVFFSSLLSRYYSNEACLFVLCVCVFLFFLLLLLFTLTHSHASDLINRLIDFVSFTPQNEKVPCRVCLCSYLPLSLSNISVFSTSPANLCYL